MKTVFILARHTFRELIRKKDFYVFLFLFVGLAAFFYSETFFGVEGVSRYLKDTAFSIIILFSVIITVTFSAKQIPSEIESKTVYPLLAKPVSRTQFVLGKFAGSVFISVVAFTVFYLLYLFFIFAKGEGAGLVLILQSYILSVCLLAFLGAIAIFLSQFFTLSANITITFLMYFFFFWYNGMLRDQILTTHNKAVYYLYTFIYYLLPHVEFYDTRIRLVHIWDPLPLWVVVALVLYAAIYISLVMLATCVLFRKRNL